MPAHLLAFSDSHSGTLTYDQLLAVADQLYTRQNNEYQIPHDAWIAWAAAMGTGLTAARLSTASLRLRGNPQIVPFDLTTFGTEFPAYMDMTDDPIKLIKEENLRVEASHTGDGPDINRAFISVQQTPFNANQNYKGGRWVRGTATVTSVAEAWSGLGAITFDDILEGGSYAVYGFYAEQASIFAARLVFQNQYERPGSLSPVLVSDNPMFVTMMRQLGLLGVFDTYSPPQLEAFSSAAASITPTVWMYIAKADGFQPPFRGQSGS